MSTGRKYRIEMAPLAGRYVVALKDPATGDLVKALSVNRTAAEMLSLYRDGLDTSAIAQSLSEKYGVPASTISRDLSRLLESLD